MRTITPSLYDNLGAGVYNILGTHNTVVDNGSTGILAKGRRLDHPD